MASTGGAHRQRTSCPSLFGRPQLHGSMLGQGTSTGNEEFVRVDVDVCLHGFVRWPDNVHVAVHIHSYGFIVLYVHLYVIFFYIRPLHTVLTCHESWCQVAGIRRCRHQGAWPRRPKCRHASKGGSRTDPHRKKCAVAKCRK